MKRIALALIAPLLAFTFAGCDETDVNGDPLYDDSSYNAPSDPGGLGLTYDGKMGYDMGGGLVYGFDGSLKPGFGL